VTDPVRPQMTIWRTRVKREREKPTRCNNNIFIINFCLNIFRASLCPSSGAQRPCYCMWCTALVLLDVVGSGCGALRCRMRALLYDSYESYPERHSNNKIRQDLTHTLQQACCYINILNLVTEVKRNIVSP